MLITVIIYPMATVFVWHADHCNYLSDWQSVWHAGYCNQISDWPSTVPNMLTSLTKYMTNFWHAAFCNRLPYWLSIWLGDYCNKLSFYLSFWHAYWLFSDASSWHVLSSSSTRLNVSLRYRLIVYWRERSGDVSTRVVGEMPTGEGRCRGGGGGSGWKDIGGRGQMVSLILKQKFVETLEGNMASAENDTKSVKEVTSALGQIRLLKGLCHHTRITWKWYCCKGLGERMRRLIFKNF
jgi:hypothetical protein